MIAPAGYSGTPLAKKLGIKPGFKISLVNAPGHYLSLFVDLPPDIVFVDDDAVLKDFIHIFAKNKQQYFDLLEQFKPQIVQNGMIWVSWPKEASKIPTDITEDIIRDHALQNGLVDVKVCAVDEVWSGLKLVIRLKDRV